MSKPHSSYLKNPTIIRLWSDDAPNNKASTKAEYTEEKNGITLIRCVQEPTIEVRLPAKRQINTPTVLIFPGGGYECLAYEWEGVEIASLLNAHGIAAVIVKYRLPDPESNIASHIVPLLDAERAIRTVRQNAAVWGIDRERIGVIGFSAGGHLASTLGTQFTTGNEKAPDPIDRLSSRPDFMGLVYPATEFSNSVSESASRDNLLGKEPSEPLIERYSNRLHITPETPPTFLLHASDDEVVPVSGTVSFYQALLREGVYAEMHLYPNGGHGFSLAHDRGRLANWGRLFVDWIKAL
ncbi:alpha/beta hydrolase [Pelagicoccus sp. SDUM812002]|uniref:alpha/beta hydrolase n=1 Tax=Pelagicoccus sp. SDUM812002 TaxID=3041266 RepID=UPI00280CC09A|nr:alpha/beta hydrolase [Pelagicoccus sp. SDUM812002]MDQ8186552.1 alpha/beta hydrolase [Pelagicoccus sp. SDUM812002]